MNNKQSLLMMTLLAAAALCGCSRYEWEETQAEPQAIFTAELVPNPREDNTVFIYSIRTVKQIS